HLTVVFATSACIIDTFDLNNTFMIEWEEREYGSTAPLSHVGGVGAQFVSNTSMYVLSVHTDQSVWLLHLSFDYARLHLSNGAIDQYRVGSINSASVNLREYGVSVDWLFIRYMTVEGFDMIYWFPLKDLNNSLM